NSVRTRAGRIEAEFGLQGSRQVAILERIGRNGGQRGVALSRAIALVVAKEKHLVSLDRAAQAAAKLVPIERRRARSLAARPRPLNLFRKRVGRKSGAVAIEPKQAAMKVVRSALRNVLRNQAGDLATFGIVISRGHLHFLDRVLRWDNDLHARVANF